MAERSMADRGLRLIAPLIMLAAGLFGAPSAHADGASSAWFETDQGKVRLIAAQAAVGAATQVQIGLEFRLAPHWKIYWRSPGDAGLPPHLDWSGSDNLAAARIAWPVPRRFSVQGLDTIGYEGTIVLPITVRLDHPGGALRLRAALDYLTCREICIPSRTNLALDLPAGAAPAGADADDNAAQIARFQALVPPAVAAGIAVTDATVERGSAPTLALQVRSDRRLAAPDVFIDAPAGIAFGPPTAAFARTSGETMLRLPISGDAASLALLPGRKLTVTLVDGARALEATVTPAEAQPPAGFGRLLSMLGLALIGGFILNLMPCVLPVLSIKLLSVIDHAGRSRLQQRLGFLATACGILLSFLALALMLIVLWTAGVAIGWGVQFQQPWFLVAMAALLTLFAANLWGVFEVPLPGFAGRLSPAFDHRSLLGNVAVGAFATLLATPCSAPFLGTAVGFALAAGPVEIFCIFLALGLGLASPYLAVAMVPDVVRWLPRPGRWMMHLRRVLGIALALTVLWLVWVLAAQIGVTGALAVGALMIMLAASLAIARRPAIRRGAPALAVLAALLMPLASPAPPPASGADGIWHPFDQASIAGLVENGHVVFVDVTADWCLSCKVNERLVLDTSGVLARLRAPGVVAMRADWTQPSETIAAYLHRFGRYGIPFNAVYGPGAPEGLPLSEFLTVEAVTDALRHAAGPPARLGAAMP